MPLLALAMPALVGAETRPLVTLMAGPSCPDAAVTTLLEAGLRRDGAPLLSHARATAAVSRVRAVRALEQARQLYTRTDFSGCIALLSITEQELGRSLTDVDADRQRRAHELLARVNLWLGICQWAAGDPQTAAASFVRSAQLPSSALPDPKQLPPELVEAYRTAVAAPREEMSCAVEPPLTAEHLEVDGKRPPLTGNAFRIPAGTHYLALKIPCAPAAGGDCASLQQRLGPEGMRSLRLEAGALRCRVALPPVPAAARIACASLGEAKDASFVAELAREAGAGGVLGVAVARGRLAMRLLRGGSVFSRQLVTQLEGTETPSRVVARSIDLLLRDEPPPPPPPPPARRRWYEQWWLWTIVGAGVVATVTAASVVATRPRDYKVVFGP